MSIYFSCISMFIILHLQQCQMAFAQLAPNGGSTSPARASAVEALSKHEGQRRAGEACRVPGPGLCGLAPKIIDVFLG